MQGLRPVRRKGRIDAEKFTPVQAPDNNSMLVSQLLYLLNHDMVAVQGVHIGNAPLFYDKVFTRHLQVLEIAIGLNQFQDHSFCNLRLLCISRAQWE